MGSIYDELDDDLIDDMIGLRYCNGDKATYLQVLGIYRNSLEERRDSIIKALEENDMDTCILQAHTLKSNSRSLGISLMGDTAERIEKAGRAGDKDRIMREIPAYKDLTERVAGAVDRYMSDRGAV